MGMMELYIYMYMEWVNPNTGFVDLLYEQCKTQFYNGRQYLLHKYGHIQI